MCDDGASTTTGVFAVPYPDDEVRATVGAYVAMRGRIEAGDAAWPELADFFTDDAVYLDPAWGRIQGRDEIRQFMADSMTGLEDWAFPVTFTAVDGDNVVVKWDQILPGRRPDGTPYVQSGYSTLVYAGDGKFSYEEDLLNMAHVLEDLAASGWRPGAGFQAPPAQPNRDFSRPA
ncbi:MAG TPA: nuclear transport factor 2 family protein [Acidimicrobiales bacterium]